MAFSKLDCIGQVNFPWKLDIPDDVYVAPTLAQLRFESPSFEVLCQNGAQITTPTFSLVVYIAKKVVWEQVNKLLSVLSSSSLQSDVTINSILNIDRETT